MIRPILVLLCTVTVLCSSTAPQQTPAVFARLQTLAGGTWVMRSPTGSSCEQWRKADAQTLHSRAFKVKGKDTIQLETVTLSVKGNSIVYTSTVADQNDGRPIAFRLVSAREDTYVFSNPQHDFPQRIVYKFIGSDSLQAWIEGDYKGHPMAAKIFYYARK